MKRFCSPFPPPDPLFCRGPYPPLVYFLSGQLTFDRLPLLSTVFINKLCRLMKLVFLFFLSLYAMTMASPPSSWPLFRKTSPTLLPTTVSLGDQKEARLPLKCPALIPNLTVRILSPCMRAFLKKLCAARRSTRFLPPRRGGNVTFFSPYNGLSRRRRLPSCPCSPRSRPGGNPGQLCYPLKTLG